MPATPTSPPTERWSGSPGLSPRVTPWMLPFGDAGCARTRHAVRHSRSPCWSTWSSESRARRRASGCARGR
eukprot:8254252-Alexandrium_andersonii.AAC.1